MQVTSDDITFVSRLVDELCGVVLDESKAYLIEHRLQDLARAASCGSYRELCQRARVGGDPELRSRIIDAITTQETLFFRDGGPFDALQYKLLPDIIDAKMKARTRTLRIWCAASSTGQEPYSVAMTIAETLPDLAQWDVRILATDISDSAIRRASMGLYTKLEIGRGMKPNLLPKYFVEQPGGWKINDRIRSMVSYQKRNLLEPFVGIGPFDVIFCRNVAIYFEAAKRRDLFLRLAERLQPPLGAIFVGSSESLLDVGPRFIPQNHCRGTFYQPHKPVTPPPPLPARALAATAPLPPRPTAATAASITPRPTAAPAPIPQWALKR